MCDFHTIHHPLPSPTLRKKFFGKNPVPVYIPNYSRCIPEGA
jgi:hypothetical protein